MEKEFNRQSGKQRVIEKTIEFLKQTLVRKKTLRQDALRNAASELQMAKTYKEEADKLNEQIISLEESIKILAEKCDDPLYKNLQELKTKAAEQAKQ